MDAVFSLSPPLFRNEKWWLLKFNSHMISTKGMLLDFGHFWFLNRTVGNWKWVGRHGTDWEKQSISTASRRNTSFAGSNDGAYQGRVKTVGFSDLCFGGTEEFPLSSVRTRGGCPQSGFHSPPNPLQPLFPFPHLCCMLSVRIALR